jgi:hypothetical protein
MVGPWVVLLATLVAAADADGDETDTDDGAAEEQSVAEAAEAAGPLQALRILEQHDAAGGEGVQIVRDDSR